MGSNFYFGLAMKKYIVQRYAPGFGWVNHFRGNVYYWSYDSATRSAKREAQDMPALYGVLCLVTASGSWFPSDSWAKVLPGQPGVKWARGLDAIAALARGVSEEVKAP